MVRYLRATYRSILRNLHPDVSFRAAWHDPARRRADIVAGITVAIVLIPQALGYALLLGLPAVNGLYAAFFGILFGALWGSSRQLITGPVGVMSLLTIGALAPFAGSSPAHMAILAAALAVMVGIIQIALGALRFGFVMRLVPQSVLTGFSISAAMVIALTQVPALIGIGGIAPSALASESFLVIARHIGELNPVTAGVGFASFIAIVVLRRMGNAFPAALLVIAAATLASFMLHLVDQGVGIIGVIPKALPTPGHVGIADLLRFGTTALALAVMGFLSSYAAAKTVGADEHEKVDADRELIGQGLANLVAGVFRGYPVSGSFSISAINHDAGGRSTLASLAAACCVVFAIFFLTPFLYYLPRATLAAVVVASVVGIIKPSKIQQLYTISRTDGLVALTTLVAALVLQPQDAVLIGVVLALFVFLRTIMLAEVEEVGIHPAWQNLQSLHAYPEAEILPKVIVVRVDRSFMYTTVERIVEELVARIDEREGRDGQPVAALVCSCQGVNTIDGSGIAGIEELLRLCADRRIRVAFAYVKESARRALERGNLAERAIILNTVDEIRAWARSVTHA